MAMRGIAPHWRAFPLLAIVLIFAFVLTSAGSGSQTAAINSGSILSITGDGSSEKVTLSINGSNLQVKGFFEGTTPAECASVGQTKLRCPMSSVDGVAIDLAGGKDAVIVADTLPIPVRAKMGAQNDSFTGAGEEDTCMGQGGKDVCTPGAGDDTCIGGGDRDSCRMGGGADVCTLGAGNDDCTGGSGEDTCRAGPGVDLCVGNTSDDLLVGGDGQDGENGGPGRDRCDPTPGPDATKSCEVILP